MMKKVFDTFYAVNPGLLPNFLILLAFIAVDYVWLRSLPRLGVSYGSGTPTYIIFSFLRIGFFVLWVFLQLLVRRVSPAVPHLTLWPFLVLNLLLLGTGIYGFLIEPFRLTETHIEVQVPGLSRRVRIVQLSDIHVERTTRREQDLPGFIESLNPDLIVITGDVINESYVNNPDTWQALRDLAGQFHAPLGVYAVNGNVETPGRLKRMFEGLDIHVLRNEVVRIPEISSHFVLVGVNYMDWDYDRKVLASLMAQTQPDDFSLLLYHNPDLIYTARDLNVDLYLAGHTHGGQVRLPWLGAIIPNSKYGKRFEMGLYRVDDTQLFVSRGIGFTGGIAPRVRFLAPPEVVTIDLVPAE